MMCLVISKIWAEQYYHLVPTCNGEREIEAISQSLADQIERNLMMP